MSEEDYVFDRKETKNIVKCELCGKVAVWHTKTPLSTSDWVYLMGEIKHKNNCPERR